jgi:hypothetical protein
MENVLGEDETTALAEKRWATTDAGAVVLLVLVNVEELELEVGIGTGVFPSVSEDPSGLERARSGTFLSIACVFNL